MTTTEFIFVYGTLRQVSNSKMSQVLQSHSEYIGMATIQAQLYAVADYTGAIASTNSEDSVQGEVYKILEPSLLTLLDDYEECSSAFPEPHEYVRKILPVSLVTGVSCLAWVYLYHHDVSRLPRIL